MENKLLVTSNMHKETLSQDETNERSRHTLGLAFAWEQESDREIP